MIEQNTYVRQWHPEKVKPQYANMYFVRFAGIYLESQIAEKIGLTQEQYEKVVVEEFNAIKMEDIFAFNYKRKRDAIRAMEWMHSAMLMRTLRNDKESK